MEQQQQQLEITLEELGKYNGVENERILISVKGVIFDVTDGPFYKPSGNYHLFAGKEASIALAKMSFDKQFLNQLDLTILDEEEKKILSDWFEKYQKKYPRVGSLKIIGDEAAKSKMQQ